MAGTPSPLSEVLTTLLGAVSNVIGAIGTAIADNADVIGTVVIVGALTVMVMTVGKKIFTGLSGWFKGFGI